MRLSDAIREAGQTKGMQVHRSHRMDLDHVAAVKRIGDWAELALSDGQIIPVSRSHLPALRKAGLLPTS